MSFWQKKSITAKQANVVTAPVVSPSATTSVAADQASKTAANTARQTTGKFSLARGVIIGPWVTEKATMLQAHGQYLFEVSRRATKVAVRQAIKEMYGVLPTKVSVLSTRGKVVRVGRYTGKRRDRKKAVVTLPQGRTIDIYKGV